MLLRAMMPVLMSTRLLVTATSVERRRTMAWIRMMLESTRAAIPPITAEVVLLDSDRCSEAVNQRGDSSSIEDEETSSDHKITIQW